MENDTCYACDDFVTDQSLAKLVGFSLRVQPLQEINILLLLMFSYAPLLVLGTREGCSSHCRLVENCPPKDLHCGIKSLCWTRAQCSTWRQNVEAPSR